MSWDFGLLGVWLPLLLDNTLFRPSAGFLQPTINENEESNIFSDERRLSFIWDLTTLLILMMQFWRIDEPICTMAWFGIDRTPSMLISWRTASVQKNKEKVAQKRFRCWLKMNVSRSDKVCKRMLTFSSWMVRVVLLGKSSIRKLFSSLSIPEQGKMLMMRILRFQKVFWHTYRNYVTTANDFDFARKPTPVWRCNYLVEIPAWCQLLYWRPDVGCRCCL